MKKIRIKFSADLIIEAETIAEAREKWEGMNLFSQDANDCGVEFSETLLIEDAETYKDISDEWDGDPEEDEECYAPEEAHAALDYIRENIDEEDLTIYRATVVKNLNHHMPISAGLDDAKIIDLLEEYGEENGLSEGWWEEFGEIEDWLMWL